MPATWESVVSNPAYQTLPPDQKSAARQQYFDTIVAPKVPKDHLDIARQQFDSFSTPKAAVIGADPIRAAYQGTMNTVVKPINAVVNAVVSPVMGTVASAESPTAQGAANIIDSTDAGQWIGDKLLAAKNTAGDVGAEIKDLESYNQDLAKDLSAFGENSQFAGNLTAAKIPIESATTQLGKHGAAALERPVGNFPKAIAVPETIIPADAVKAASQNAYKYSENVGGILHPDNFTNPVLDIIDSAKAKPIAGKVLTSEQRSLNAALDEYSPLRDSPLTLDDFQNLDKSLGAKESAAMNGFQSTNNSRIIGQVQDQIREKLQNLKPKDVIGGKEGFDALTEHAIPLWSTQTKMADLETLINKAKGTLNPAQSMRTALNNLINSPKFNNYPDIAKNAIRKAATNGNADDLIGFLGSRLNPIMSNTIAGKATNMITSKITRNIRNSVQNAKADKIMRAMTNPVRESVEKFSTLPESPYPMKPELPTDPVNPYFNPKSGIIKNPPPTISGVGALENIGEKEVPVELQGTASSYYKNGGSVKNPNLTAEFLATRKRA